MFASSCLLLLLAASPAAAADWRLRVEPADPAETALHDAALRDGVAATDALVSVSRRFPGTETSGLARLAAGLRLLDAGRPADALPHLTHADVQQTLLRDHALFAIGRAEEASGRPKAAARAYLAASAEEWGSVGCTALPRAAELFARAGTPEETVPALERVAASCPGEAPDALLALGEALLSRGDRSAAVTAFERLDHSYPTSAPAKTARARLVGLAAHLPTRSPAERTRLLLDRGTALLAGGLTAEAVPYLRAIPLASLTPEDADFARVQLGRALLARRRTTEGQGLLQKIPPDSKHAAEAAFYLARDRARRTRSAIPFEAVADRFPGTTWAEEALLSLANHYQKDAFDEAALPWWRRLLAEFPDGRHVERAAWRVGWADYRAGRYERAAHTLEVAARLRPPSGSTAGFLYWSGRAQLALGHTDRARLLLAETVQRYKHSYHGVRATEALAKLGGVPGPPPAVVAAVPLLDPPLPEPRATRLRRLLLVERLDEAAQELRLLPESSRVQATLAWIDWRQGRYRPAIVTMKRAYPEWIGEAGDRLPPAVWRILFPIRYDRELRDAAQQAGTDPSLVAALVLQESSYDPEARSHAGARGLMQVMPATGRRIARDKGQRYRRAALHDPETSLDFGTHYLRKMSERYSGQVEKVLAAYNAGPHRVDAWTAQRGEVSAEEFIESIPFSETRTYVMIVLANREQYRRLYGLDRTPPAPVSEGARP